MGISARGDALLGSPTHKRVRWGWGHHPSRPPGSSSTSPALLKGFELQNSTKTQAGRLYTAAVVSASWHPTSSPQIILIIYLRVRARENCWGASRLQAQSKSGRKKQLLAMAGAPASGRDGAGGHEGSTTPAGNGASLLQAAPGLSQEHSVHGLVPVHPRNSAWA